MTLAGQAATMRTQRRTARTDWGEITMTGRDFGRCCLVLALLDASLGAPAFALGTAFTYQGQLQQGGAPADGSCDFQFSLWDALGSGAPPMHVDG